mmetsp:Transcript_58401/g.123882  ORF Transcript_58401/g.123882 Transcript_58401/m.123882 type:complete len:316 (-) Transcript_58401:15-962(-)
MASSSESVGGVAAGKVYLVGAGPGGMGLLTLRALEVLCSADVILYDRLVPMDIVKLAKPGAELRNVGKEGTASTEKMKVQQDDIGVQLVDLAKKGCSVCRLKGGDPMIFARIGEEMEACASGGVPFEVVPAVTAALAGAADAWVPLTYRKQATEVRILTMNPSATKDPAFDWNQFVAPNVTFCLYMGLAVLPTVSEKLVAAGVPSDRPMAIVDRASLGASQTVSGTVGSLPSLTAARTDLTGPAMVILGDVVAIRDRLSGSAGASPQTIPTTPKQALSASLTSMSQEDLISLKAEIDTLLNSPTRPKRNADEMAA